MSVIQDLRRESEAAQALLANLRDVIGDDEDLRMGTLEGETRLIEIIGLALRKIGEDETAIAALKNYSEALETRAERMKQRVDLARVAVLAAMAQGEIKKLETPFGTVSRRTVAPSAIIVNEAEIPTEYWKARDPALDRAKLTAALREGKAISGATLSNGGEALTIRRD